MGRGSMGHLIKWGQESCNSVLWTTGASCSWSSCISDAKSTLSPQHRSERVNLALISDLIVAQVRITSSCCFTGGGGGGGGAGEVALGYPHSQGWVAK